MITLPEGTTPPQLQPVMAANNPYKELLTQLGAKLSTSEAANRTHELRIAEQEALIATESQTISHLQAEIAKGKHNEQVLTKEVKSRSATLVALRGQAEAEIRRLQGVIAEMGIRLESQACKNVSRGRPSKSGIAPALGAVPTIGPVQQVQTAAATDRTTVADSVMRDAAPVQTPDAKRAVRSPAEKPAAPRRDLIEVTDGDEESPIQRSPPPPAKRKNPSIAPRTPRLLNKRSHLEADLADLNLSTDTSLLKLTSSLPAKRQRKSKLSSLNTTESFDFKLVQSYSPGPTKRKHIINYFDSSAYASTDSKANLSELTASIERLNTDVWERGNEEPWQSTTSRRQSRIDRGFASLLCGLSRRG
ncbi:hypothetical protein B0A48_15521 [Cryoendolithus antarcticus]|uniref:Uncharacterized protein n=1 Tax=Cryoendolithus antarcticus TaxID=1507870 RepID=A0A1V8SGI0_9PEZI|nr:hypothetical protein B0A48_15521 [Cryoendolithus antarcticus]